MIFEEENNLDSKATPEEVEDTPEEVEATPEEVEATPEEVEAIPEEVKTDLDDEGSSLDGDSKDYSQVSIFGEKVGMSRIFLDGGDSDCPVTVIQAGPCYVTQLKSLDSDGYSSVQISYGDMKLYKVTISLNCHYKMAYLEPM